MEKFTTTSQTLQPDKYANMKWHNYLTLDVFIKVFNQTLLHPFVAWIVVLCLRAQVTPYEHPSMIIAISWASILTVLAGLKYINERIAYGTPREVDLSREVIVVTGGGSGLGQLIAQIYGMRGASVAVVDVKEVSEVEGWDELSGVEYYQCDVGDRKALELTASRIENDLGRPSVIINCAAAAIHRQSFLGLSSNAMMETIRTNLLGPFHTIQIFLPGIMASRNGGTIVNVSSVLGQLTAAGLSDYATSKAGLSALHRSLAAELQEYGLSGKVKLLLVETGQMSTPLFDNIKTPNRFFAPVLEPIQVAYQIVSAIDNGKAGVMRLPAFAKLVNWYAVFPVSIQKLVRYLSGIDKATGAELISRNPHPEAAISSESDSDMELVNVE